MLLPQFSLRLLLSLLTASAGASLILSFAYRGETWALAATVGLLMLGLMLLLHAAAFAGLSLFAAISHLRQAARPRPATRSGETAVEIPLENLLS